MLKAVVFGYRYIELLFYAAAHNALVDMMIKYGEAAALKDIIWLFEHLPKDDPLLELFVALECKHPDWTVNKELGSLVKGQDVDEFFRRVKVVGERRWVELTACDFHVHATVGEKEECEQRTEV